MQLKAGFIKNFEGMSGKLKKSTIRHFDTQLMQFIDVKRPIVFLEHNNHYFFCIFTIKTSRSSNK